MEPAPQPGPAGSGELDGDLAAAVLRGVSADLCEALLTMLRAPRVRRVDFSFYWAQGSGGASPPVTRAAVRAEDADGLRVLRDRLAALPEPLRTAVYGQVTRLDRGAGDDDGGVVTIHGVVGPSTPRTVRVEVCGREYDDAIRAYRTRAPVLATGRLRRGGGGGAHLLTGRLTIAELPH
ncbi:MAG: hypothetical protein IRZ08_22265 [Frankia sp.]|nr:hypothetical protein [Frankia sp.]